MSGTAAPPALRARWPWVLLAFFVALAAAGMAGVVAHAEAIGEQIPFVIAFSMFGIVGSVVLSREPRNRIGAILLYGSCMTAVSFASGELATSLVRSGRTDGVVVSTAFLMSALGWLLGLLPVLVLLPLLFPDGRLPSPRWRRFAWVCAAVFAYLAAAVVLGSKTLTGSTEDVTLANPLYVPAFGRLGLSDIVVLVLIVLTLLGSVVSLVLRFRRARGIERQQIKWVALAVVFVLVSFVLAPVLQALGLSSFVAETLIGAAAFLSIPVSIGVAVLQYRLYDLDVVVKKTLIAGSLALLVIAVYAAVVWVVGAVASDRASSLSVFVTALLLGLAFRPVTRYARRIADRLVYGRRATPYEVLTEFSERVGDAYATDDLLGRMAQILGQGVGAAEARVWLLVGGRLRAAGSFPSQVPAVPPVTVEHDRLPDLAGETAVEVRDRGELLGALSVTMPPNDPMTETKAKLVRDLASQAGLALRNVRLVEELKASQRRIVTAQDQERRRLERNIHDGAQQQLVALAVKMRLAQTMATKDGERTAAMLGQLQEETQKALEDLRDLARGIYPPLLADQGLPAAVEAQVRRSAIPVRISPDSVGRYAPEVEAAVYFSVLEGLQNVAKYAGAERAEVDLRDEDGWLSFTVRDDGDGFDPAETGYGTGLQGIADRLAALDGGLQVRSSVGAGTVLVGRVPVRARVEARDLERSQGARGGN